MLLKKTVVRLGSTFFSTHFDHVFKTLLYATGRSISSYSVDPSSNDPRLSQYHQITNQLRAWFWVETLNHQSKIYKDINLQNFHAESVHPPDVCVKNQVVDILPVDTMLINWFRHDYSVQDAVHIWIVGVWLDQKRGPIELHCCIIVLRRRRGKKTSKHYEYSTVIRRKDRVTDVICNNYPKDEFDRHEQYVKMSNRQFYSKYW
jgi:hypothetical protein